MAGECFNAVSKGCRFLGGFFGDHDSTKAFVRKKIIELTNSVVRLLNHNLKQPFLPWQSLYSLNGHTCNAYSPTLMTSMS